MEKGMDWSKILLLLLPILVIQIGLQIYALIDLSRQEQIRGSKWMWVLIILLGEIFGPILYFTFARKES
jgi:hypothetical protein